MQVKNTKDVVAVIPFYNEKPFIKEIINQTLPFVQYIIAVDDGSTDGSSEQILGIERVMILKHNSNLGKGAALRTGYKKSAEMGAQYIVALDADLQHAPQNIPLFVFELEKYPVVIGYRKREFGVMPIQRIASNFITSAILSVKIGVSIKDSQSGFRGFRSDIIDLIMPTRNGFEAETEQIILAAKNNLAIGWVPIPTVYGEEKSSIKPIEAIKGFIKTVIEL